MNDYDRGYRDGYQRASGRDGATNDPPAEGSPDGVQGEPLTERRGFNEWVEREYTCATRDEVAWARAGWNARAARPGPLHCPHCVDDEMSPGEHCPGIAGYSARPSDEPVAEPVARRNMTDRDWAERAHSLRAIANALRMGAFEKGELASYADVLEGYADEL